MNGDRTVSTECKVRVTRPERQTTGLWSWRDRREPARSGRTMCVPISVAARRRKWPSWQDSGPFMRSDGSQVSVVRPGNILTVQKMNRLYCLALFISALFVSAMAQATPRAALEFFRGTWTLQGHESTYSEVCEWLPGGGFLACRAEDRSENAPDFSLSVFGYSETDSTYTYNGFSGRGSHRELRGSLHGQVWRLHGQAGRAPNWRRWQVTITPTSSGFHFLEEVSDNSGPWREVVQLQYVRTSVSGG